MNDSRITAQEVEYHLRQSCERAILIASPALSITEEAVVKRIVDEMISNSAADIADLCEKTVHTEVLLEIETRDATAKRLEEEGK